MEIAEQEAEELAREEALEGEDEDESLEAWKARRLVKVRPNHFHEKSKENIA